MLTCIMEFHMSSDMSSDGAKGIGPISFDGSGGANDNDRLSNGL